VIYLPVVKTWELAVVHKQIAAAVSSLATGINEYYAEDIWIPHITIAEGDVDLPVLPEIVRRFGEKNFRWELNVTNFAVIRATEDVQEVCFRCDFSA
jgi:2'-5' RNA ligase